MDAVAKQQIEGFVGKKLWRQGQRPRGKPQPIEDHSGQGLARSDRHWFGVYQAAAVVEATVFCHKPLRFLFSPRLPDMDFHNLYMWRYLHAVVEYVMIDV